MSLINKASLILTPNAVKESKLYSIIPSNGNGDMSVVRATTATRVNSDGLIEVVPYNLAGYSEQFNQSYWNKTRCTITANSTNSPNGTLTADTLVGNSIAGENYVFVPQNATIGVPNVLSFYVKPINVTSIAIVSFTQIGRSAFSLIGAGSVTGNSGICSGGLIESLQNGWYRISTTITPTTTGVNNVGIGTSGFGIVGDCFYIWGAQLVQGSIPKDYFYTTDRLNVPRLDYSNGSCPSILVEPQRTNLVLRSGDFENLTWNKSTMIYNSTAVCPDGTNSARNYSTNGAYSVIQPSTSIVTTASTYYTVSVFLKYTSGVGKLQVRFSDPSSANYIATTVDLILGTVSAISYAGSGANGSATIKQFPDGWFRVTVSGTLTQIATGLQVTNANLGATTFSVWGGQLEQGAYSTSYIPTTTASVTRNADVFTRNNIYTNGLITSAGGTWYVELNNNIALQRDSSGSEMYIGESDISSINPYQKSINIRNNGGGNRSFSICYWNGNTLATLYNITASTAKIAIKFNGTTLDAFVNGVKVITNESVPITLANLQYFNFLGGTTRYIKSTMLFPTPLTDLECTQLTTL